MILLEISKKASVFSQAGAKLIGDQTHEELVETLDHASLLRENNPPTPWKYDR